MSGFRRTSFYLIIGYISLPSFLPTFYDVIWLPGSGRWRKECPPAIHLSIKKRLTKKEILHFVQNDSQVSQNDSKVSF